MRSAWPLPPCNTSCARRAWAALTEATGPRAPNRCAATSGTDPGELIHVDVKKIAAIPPGGGWRLHGRGNDTTRGHSGVGYRYIHTALDDRSRLVYSEI